MDTEPASPAPRTFYEAVGGDEFFDRLVHRFYELVAADPELDAMLWDYLVMAAHSLLNRPSEPPAGQDLGLTPR